MEIKRCKGSRDLLPQDMIKFRHIEEVFRSCCLGWGYNEVRTPTLEYLHLFTSVGTLTPSMLSRVYSFLDWDGWSGERVVLRPEVTIPAARLWVENIRSHPAKLFYVENIFSFEETGRESRERWQCGAELIGSPRATADVELVLLALEIFKKLGLKPELYLSHAGLIRDLLEELGLEPQEQSQVFDQILDGNTRVLREVVGSKIQLGDSLPLLFELKGKSPGFLRNLKASLAKALPKFELSLNNFLDIVEHLTNMRCEYQIDIASGRGFEYYTGVLFQFYLQGQKVGGGGRYDELIPLLGGGNIPASGFALYVDQLMDFFPLKDVPKRVLVKSEISTTEGWKQAFEVASSLREAGYVAEIDPGYKEKTDHKWILRIGEGALLLTDQTLGKEIKASSIADLLKALADTK